MSLISRRSAVEPFHAMDVLARANELKAQGKPVISMAVGQPADPVPAPVRQAAEKALADGRIGYTDSLGLASLRDAVAGYYAGHHGLDVSPERIAITSGSSAGFNLAFLALFDAGDRVAITRPGYPAYRNILAALGIEVVEIPVGVAEGGLDADRLAEIHVRTPLKGLLFASPANPTGQTLAPGVMRQLVLKGRELGITVISDEIYHRLCYSGPDHTALSDDEGVTVINSFSKYYCMTGWRVGWMVLPKQAVRPVERIAQSLYISPPELSQHAAVAAFGCTSHYEAIRARYLENRSLLQSGLPDAGLPLASPMDGAFYAWCDASGLTDDTMQFARRLLEEAHVAATPGIDFDPVNGHRFLRLSYAGSPQSIAEALERIRLYARA